MFVFGIPCTQAKAFFPLVIAGVTIAPEIVAAGVALLIAGGLVFASQTDAETAFKHMYLSSSPQMRANLAFLKVGVNVVTDYVWSGVNSYINKFFAPSQTDKTVNVLVGEHTFGSTTLPYTTNNTYPYVISKNTFTMPMTVTAKTLEGSTIVNKTISEGAVIYPIFSGTGNYYIKFYINGTYYDFYDNGQSTTANSPAVLYTDVNFFISRSTDGYYWLCVNYLNSNYNMISTYKLIKLESATDQLPLDTAYKASSSSAVSATNDYKNSEGTRNISVPTDSSSLVGATAADVQSYAAPTTSTPSTDTPTNTVTYPNTWTGGFKDCTANMTGYTFAGSGTITGDMDYSRTGTWNGSWSWTSTGARQWTGTYTDASGNTWTGTATQVLEDAGEAVTPGMAEETKTWWQNALNTVSTPIAGALEGMAGTLADIKKAIADGLQTATKPLIDAVTGVKDAVIADTAAEATAEPDITPTVKDYNIPDLFILILKVVLACIRLVLRCSVYLATIVAITPDSSLLNANAVSGIDFFKNQNIPNLNVSIWTLFSSLITVLFGLAVVKRIRTMYSV
jgi:hypothetical protein